MHKLHRYCHLLYNGISLYIIIHQALAVTITTFLLEPLEYIGEGIGKLVRGSLQGLPVYLWPYVLVFLTLLVLLILIMGCGYKIRLPFLFSLEPHRMNVDPARLTQSLEDIQNQVTMATVTLFD